MLEWFGRRQTIALPINSVVGCLIATILLMILSGEQRKNASAEAAGLVGARVAQGEPAHVRGDDHDTRHRSHKRPMHQLAALLRRLSNARSFNKCLLIQLVGKIASCPLINRAITTSHLSGCHHRANRSIWLNHVQWE